MTKYHVYCKRVGDILGCYISLMFYSFIVNLSENFGISHYSYDKPNSVSISATNSVCYLRLETPGNLVDKVNLYALKKEKKFVKVGLLQWGQ